MTPLEVAASSLAVVNAGFTLTTNIWKLGNVKEDLDIGLQLLRMIKYDIHMARELRNRKFRRDGNPTLEQARIEKYIEDLDKVALDIGGSLEAIRVAKEADNFISLKKRVEWVYNKKDNFGSRQYLLDIAHRRVQNAIITMEALPDRGLGFVDPPSYANSEHAAAIEAATPSVYEKTTLRSPSEMRALEGKSTVLLETSPPLAYERTILSPSQLRALEGKSTALLDNKDAPSIGMTEVLSYHLVNTRLSTNPKSV
ncbi:MAG: hypothetical protein Q9187_005649 [Circinaria calcarea]